MTAPAGWYVDPQNPQLMRFFDGQSWTTQTQPAPAAPTAPQSPTAAPQTGGSGLSYEHPGRQSAAQSAGQQSGQPGYGRPGQNPTEQQGFGQPGSQPSGYQPAQQPGAQPAGAQPGYGQAPAGGYQPGAAGQPAGGEPPAKTPRGVKLAIAGAAVGAVAIMGVGFALSADGEPAGNGLSARDLGVPDDFDCDALADEAINLSKGDAPDVQLLSVSDLVEKKNNFGSVVAPEGSKYALVMQCSGDGSWGDGSDTSLVLRLTLDSNEDLYVEYAER